MRHGPHSLVCLQTCSAATAATWLIMYSACSSAGGLEALEPLDKGYRAADLQVTLLLFSLALVQQIPRCGPVPPVWNGKVYSVPLYVQSMYSAFSL